MSKENVVKFMERLKTDAATRERFSQLENWQAKKAFIEEAGFSFSRDELEAFAEELSDDELEGVAGGDCSTYCHGKTCENWGSCFCVQDHRPTPLCMTRC